MEDYKGNSDASKRASETSTSHVESPVTTDVKVKNNEARKFFAQDASTAVKNICKDVVVPRTKELISSILTGFINSLLFGSFNVRGNGVFTDYNGLSSSRSRVSFGASFDPNRGLVGQRSSFVTNTDINNVRNVEFPDRGIAEDKLLCMEELIDRYGSASVQQFYDLVGLKCSFTCGDFGWRDLSKATVKRGMEGYYIDFPTILCLK